MYHICLPIHLSMNAWVASTPLLLRIMNDAAMIRWWANVSDPAFSLLDVCSEVELLIT